MIQIFRGEFFAGRPTGLGELTIIKNPSNPTIYTYKNINYKKFNQGRQKNNNFSPFYQANLAFPAMSKTYNSSTAVGNKEGTGSESETALEALDGYLETLEIIRRQPRIDQWKVNRVAQFMFNVRFSRETVKKFSDNAIDGYALLVLDQSQLAELTEESDRVIQEISKLKKLWVKVLRSKDMLEECMDVLQEFNVQIDPVEEKPQNDSIEMNIQRELDRRNFFIPYEQIITSEEPRVRHFFNGLEVTLVKREPLNPQHLDQYIMQEIACLKNSRHPSILLCLGATLYKGELYLIKSKPPEGARTLTDFL